MISKRDLDEIVGCEVVQIDINMDEGFEIKQSVGWETICARARAALDSVPATTVLAGHSMGAGVVGEIWPERPKCRGVVLLHGLANIPARMRKDLPVVVHIADPDPFASQEAVASWAPMATMAGARADVFTYPNVGTFTPTQRYQTTTVPRLRKRGHGCRPSWTASDDINTSGMAEWVDFCR